MTQTRDEIEDLKAQVKQLTEKLDSAEFEFHWLNKTTATKIVRLTEELEKATAPTVGPKIRIAVALGSDGSWSAVGGSLMGDGAMETAVVHIGPYATRYWVDVTLPSTTIRRAKGVATKTRRTQ